MNSDSRSKYMAKVAKRIFQIAVALPPLGIGFVVWMIPLLISTGLIPQPQKAAPASMNFNTADAVAIIAVFAGFSLAVVVGIVGVVVCLIFGNPTYPSHETEAAWRLTAKWRRCFYVVMAIVILLSLPFLG